MYTFEHVLERLVEVHHDGVVDVHLEYAPIDLAMILTTVLMCHVYFGTCSWETC